MDRKLLDIYSDYLISSFGQTTATGLSALTEGEISHDKITRFLNKKEFGSKELWELVKPTVRKLEKEEAVIIFDDTIEEKLYTDENEITAWYYDHSLKRNVKGVNLLNCLYYVDEVSIPIGFEVVEKTKRIIDKKSGKEKRVSEKTKNEMMREMLLKCQKNQLKYSYVLADSWFSSNENMKLIHSKLEKHFIFPIKDNRLVALSKEDKLAGRFISVESMNLEENSLSLVWLQGLDFAVILTKQIFTNKDDSKLVQYLISNDLTLSSSAFSTIYKKRWKVEEFHKSLKSNLGFSKSPTHTKTSQTNHFFASIFAFFKLELLNINAKLNHFSLKSKLYFSALKASLAELKKLSAQLAA